MVPLAQPCHSFFFELGLPKVTVARYSVTPDMLRGENRVRTHLYQRQFGYEWNLLHLSTWRVAGQQAEAHIHTLVRLVGSKSHAKSDITRFHHSDASGTYNQRQFICEVVRIGYSFFGVLRPQLAVLEVVSML